MRTTIRVPATTANLGPGFDCLGLALDIWNEFSFETASRAGGQSIEITGFGKSLLPADGSNLVFASFNRVFRRLGLEPPGIRARALLGFPIGSGLGSSASAIAAGVLAARAFAGERSGEVDVLRAAVEIEGHPDNVSAALSGGLTVSFQDENELVTVPVGIAPGWVASVIVPEIVAPTAAMRAALPEQVALKDAVFNLGRTALVVRALERGDEDLLKSVVADRLHQPVRLPLIPGAAAALDAARHAGAAAALSGAGPGLIALSMRRETAHQAAAAMSGVFGGLSIGVWTWEGGLSERGAEQVTVTAPGDSHSLK